MDAVRDLSVTGHRLAIEHVYREQRERLWRALFAYTGHREMADDALAETFALALARLGQIRQPEEWVWRVAFRLASRELRRRARQRQLHEERSYDLREPIDHVVSALSRISPNQRLAVVLHDYADRPTDEVAATLGISRATVHVHLSQGRRRLRRMLEDDDG